MTSSQGSATALESIASFRLYLNVSDHERDFLTGRPSPLLLNDQLLSTQLVENTRPNQHQSHLPGQPYKPLMSTAPPHSYASGLVEPFRVRPASTMLAWLQTQGSRFSSFLAFVQFYRLQPYLDATEQTAANTYTLFAPEDCTTLWKLARAAHRTPEELLRFHMLDYTLLPVQIHQRVLRVQSMLDGERFLVHGYSVRDGEAVTNPDAKVLSPNRITQSQSCDNGFVFAIQKALAPSTQW